MQAKPIPDKTHPKIWIWATLIVILVYVGIVIGMLLVSSNVNDGHIIYPVDDTYIHMAMAKNLANHGVWGVSSKQFSASSSSPGFTLLLGLLFAIFGEVTVIPLILNGVVCILLLLLAMSVFRRFDMSPATAAIASILMVFLTPLPAMTILGMEHSLHILVTVLFVFSAVELIFNESAKPVLLWLLSALIMTLRYESLFTVFVVAIVLMFYRRFKAALVMCVAAAIPVVTYGVIATSMGSMFFPNSILMKGTMPDHDTGQLFYALTQWTIALEKNPHLLCLFLILALGAVLLMRRHQTLRTPIFTVSIINVSILIAHMSFAKTGWYYRYEAYICALGVMAVALTVQDICAGIEWNRQKRGLLILAVSVIVFVGVPLFSRGLQSITITSKCTHNIYQQAYQMGRFLKDYYPGEDVVVHDIGAVTFQSDVTPVDFLGLATVDITLQAKETRLSLEVAEPAMDRVNAQVAVIYKPWFGRLLLGDWREVGRWRISGEAISCGEPHVTFYARGDASIERLKTSLKAFETQLPEGVRVGY